MRIRASSGFTRQVVNPQTFFKQNATSDMDGTPSLEPTSRQPLDRRARRRRAATLAAALLVPFLAQMAQVVVYEVLRPRVALFAGSTIDWLFGVLIAASPAVSAFAGFWFLRREFPRRAFYIGLVYIPLTIAAIIVAWLAIVFTLAGVYL